MHSRFSIQQIALHNGEANAAPSALAVGLKERQYLENLMTNVARSGLAMRVSKRFPNDGVTIYVVVGQIAPRDEDSPCHFFTSALQSALGCSRNPPPGPTRCVTLFDIEISLQHVSEVTRHKVPLL